MCTAFIYSSCYYIQQRSIVICSTVTVTVIGHRTCASRIVFAKIYTKNYTFHKYWGIDKPIYSMRFLSVLRQFFFLFLFFAPFCYMAWSECLLNAQCVCFFFWRRNRGKWMRQIIDITASLENWTPHFISHSDFHVYIICQKERKQYCGSGFSRIR